jgi:hypothetical protein
MRQTPYRLVDEDVELAATRPGRGVALGRAAQMHPADGLLRRVRIGTSPRPRCLLGRGGSVQFAITPCPAGHCYVGGTSLASNGVFDWRSSAASFLPGGFARCVGSRSSPWACWPPLHLCWHREHVDSKSRRREAPALASRWSAPVDALPRVRRVRAALGAERGRPARPHSGRGAHPRWRPVSGLHRHPRSTDHGGARLRQRTPGSSVRTTTRRSKERGASGHVAPRRARFRGRHSIHGDR